MKSLRLRDLRNKPNRYFRDFGNIQLGQKTSIKALEYLAERSFEALPSKLKKYVQRDKQQIIDTTAHSILVDGAKGQWNAYEAIKQQAEFRYKSSGDKTKDAVWRIFKEQASEVYNHYNTYVYRLGSSARNWFMENFDYTQQGSILMIYVELPIKMTGTIYKQLYIEINMSGFNADGATLERATMS